MNLHPQANEILNFWFSHPEDAEYGNTRNVWYTKNPAFDEEISSRFFTEYELAAAGKYDSWQESPQSCLALIILLDQFPRNMFRGQPQAFATDYKALAAAQYAVDHTFDQQLLPVQRQFIYLPFEHSENLEHQRRCVELFQQLKDSPDSALTLDYAIRHLKIIEQFGRFPHRNEILGRESTAEEVEFLKQAGSSF